MPPEDLEYRVKHLKRFGEDSPREAILREVLIWGESTGHLPDLDLRRDEPARSTAPDPTVTLSLSLLESLLRKTIEIAADHVLSDRPFAPRFVATANRPAAD